MSTNARRPRFGPGSMRRAYWSAAELRQQRSGGARHVDSQFLARLRAPLVQCLAGQRCRHTSAAGRGRNGPFLASEAVGGHGIFDVASIDEAVALLRTFPAPSGKLEIRPVLER